MKYFLISMAILSTAIGVNAQQISAMNKDIKNGLTIDVGIGVGSVYSNPKGMFTQRIGAEWNILPRFLANDISMAVGFYVNNNYGGGIDVHTVGTYDYSYTVFSNSDIYGVTSNRYRRQGSGSADVRVRRDDISFLPTVSLRYHCTDKLEAYISLGVGLSLMNSMTGSYINSTGFSSANVVNQPNSGTASLTYNYNDLDHVKWSDTSWTKASPAVSAYLGARYFFTEHWGINAQLGLISANIKKSVGNSYNVFSIGASYRF